MIYFVSNVAAKANKSIMLDQPKFYGLGRAAPEQNPQKPTRKKVYSANMLFYGSIMGSVSVPARAGPQKWFYTNCKRVMRVGGMRGLLELLL